MTMNRPIKATKKPIEVEAFYWDGRVETATLIINWVLANGGTARYHEAHDTVVESGEPPKHIPAYIAVDTIDSTGRVYEGDWVMHGAIGEFYPCNGQVFEDTYDYGT